MFALRKTVLTLIALDPGVAPTLDGEPTLDPGDSVLDLRSEVADEWVGPVQAEHGEVGYSP